ncbi:hypothetical protein HQ545_00970 [Candidatus Woesearchaeota archaeon]|nr:hypothetical protein [Candidatus Woesearchaeota archaeon]
MEQLQIDFDQELDLFLRIASPITLKEKNFAALAKITRPLKDIPAQAKNNFLKFLDLSIHTFQDVNVSFVKSLQETDFRNIDDFSFVELVYIYLKFAENPELKINNLKKSLKKLKKEENKCLKLINDKISYENLNSMEKKKLSATLQKISEMFFDSVLTLYSETAKDRIKYSLENTFKIKIKNISKKTDNESFFNALCILKTLEEDKHPNYPHCFNLIKHYLEDKTYPLKREILNCYPWTLPQNKDWCKNHLSNKEWLKDFRKEYVVTSKDKEKTNVEERIKHHLEQAQKIITELHLEIKGLNLNNIEELYKKLAKEKTKYPGSLISDLKTQISAIKSLQGEKKAGKISVGKIIIQPEFDPLEILQMGNYVSGSCLATNGANYWSTVTNAIEVNKRILWAKDSKGKIIARILIAVDKNNNILKFPIYYEITTNLNKYFDEYLVELAKKCGFGLKGNKDNVEELITDEWYSDSEIEIELDHL